MNEKQQIENLKRLVAAQEEFIKILGDELSEIVPFMVNHHWKSTRFEAGKAAREKIQKLREQI
jgi:hypothetical protein